MLTAQQAREYNRFKKLEDFLNDEEAVYASFLPFANEVDEFHSNFKTLNKLIPDKTNISTGITTDKTTLKQQAAAALALVCRKTLAFANRYNRLELAAETNTREDRIFKMKDSGVLAYAQHIEELLTPLLTDADYIPYGVTDATLTDVVDKAATFNNLIGRADEKQSGNTTANRAINEAIKQVQENIDQMDLLVDEFEATNPPFVQGYHINSAVDNIGVRHTGIEGHVLLAGAPVAGAMVEIKGTGKTTTTDLLGFYKIERVMPGDYEVAVSANGSGIKSKIQHISRGRIEEVNFEM